MSKRDTFHYKSPIGWLELRTTERGISSCRFVEDLIDTRNPEEELSEALDQYFLKGKTLQYDLDLRGTAFQLSVWNHLMTVPLGKTISYASLAEQCGGANYSRAVAAANGANPILLFVPCHRVIGSDGSLTGYAGGLDRKRWLLDHESGQGSLF